MIFAAPVEVMPASEEVEQAEFVSLLTLHAAYVERLWASSEERLRTERRLGQLLKSLEVRRRGRWSRDETTGQMTGAMKTLPDGVTKTQSYRWRRIAFVPELEFERWIAEKRANDEELTQRELLQIADRLIWESENRLDGSEGCGDGVSDDDDSDDEERDADAEQEGDGYLKPVRLLTTVGERRRLESRCKRLREVYGTSGLTTTVIECVRRAAESR